MEWTNDFKLHYTAFPCFSTVIEIALSLPISTARVESCFSTLTQILRPQRLKMEFDRLPNLVLLAFNKNITASLEPEHFIDKFASSNRRLILKNSLICFCNYNITEHV